MSFYLNVILLVSYNLQDVNTKVVLSSQHIQKYFSFLIHLGSQKTLIIENNIVVASAICLLFSTSVCVAVLVLSQGCKPVVFI